MADPPEQELAQALQRIHQGDWPGLKAAADKIKIREVSKGITEQAVLLRVLYRGFFAAPHHHAPLNPQGSLVARLRARNGLSAFPKMQRKLSFHFSWLRHKETKPAS